MDRLEADKQSLMESNAGIEVLAHRETLTNLPNRALARDRLSQLLAQAKRDNAITAVLFLDLDNFKTINDSLGHAAEDTLLCQVAERLSASVRDSDTVSREGGDEEAITAAANKVMLQLAQPFVLNGMEVLGTASLGESVYPRDGTDTETLLKNADLAMYRAKVAERTGLINKVGSWVLASACRQMQAWRKRVMGDRLVVAINVSPIQFRRDDIEREVANALTSCGLPPSAVELELTESLLVADTQHLSEVLQRMGAQGIKFAIDDFGTGYSNLGYLQHFPIHLLKIDQSFIRKLVDSPNESGIVRAVIEMAHCLKLEVVAEGVEDADTLQRLIDNGCKFGQGHHWAIALVEPT